MDTLKVGLCDMMWFDVEFLVQKWFYLSFLNASLSRTGVINGSAQAHSKQCVC